MKGIEDDTERCIIVSAGLLPFHIATIENGQPGDCCATELRTAQRIVDCVTACKGLKPQAVPAMVEAFKALIGAEELFVNQSGQPWADSVTDAVETAKLALIKAQEGTA